MIPFWFTSVFSLLRGWHLQVVEVSDLAILDILQSTLSENIVQCKRRRSR